MWPSKMKPNYGIFVKKIFNQLYQHGLTCNIVCLKGVSPYLQPFLYLFFYIRTFFVILLKSPKVIYIHYSSHSSLGVLLAYPFFNGKVVTHVHGSDLLGENVSTGVFFKINQLILRRSDYIVAPSVFFERILVANFECSKDKIFVSPSGGIDETIFFPPSTSRNNNRIVFGFASNLIEGKGCLELIQSVQLIPIERRQRIELKIVGNGVMREQLISYVDNNSLTDCVSFQPTLTHPKLGEFFRSIDCFVFPTKLPESLGLVGLEAMACGVPVIGSNIGGLGTYIVERFNGFFVVPGNVSDLALEIDSFILLDKESLLDLSSNCLSTSNKYLSSNVSTSLIAKFRTML